MFLSSFYWMRWRIQSSTISQKACIQNKDVTKAFLIVSTFRLKKDFFSALNLFSLFGAQVSNLSNQLKKKTAQKPTILFV